MQLHKQPFDREKTNRGNPNVRGNPNNRGNLTMKTPNIRQTPLWSFPCIIRRTVMTQAYLQLSVIGCHSSHVFCVYGGYHSWGTRQ
jgi:hypothetical protein